MAITKKDKARGLRIKHARLAIGWSQDALADELDTRQTTVARWEKGVFPSRIGLPRIAEALGRSVDWLLNGSDASDRQIKDSIIETVKKMLPEEIKRAKDAIDEDEEKLLRLYRRANSRGKEGIIKAATKFANQSRRKRT